jgi:hydrogenase expression/formation protein HypC
LTIALAEYKKVAMCLAIPGKVEEITTDGLIRVGRVNFGGVVKKVCLDYVPEVEVGDYTIVHVGFAISKIDEATAEQTLADFRAMGVLDEELAEGEEAFARAAKRPQSNCPDGSCDAASQQVGESADKQDDPQRP